MHPDQVIKMIQPWRKSIKERLKKFEQERNERIREAPMLEDEKQKYVRKYMADQIKGKFLKILMEHLKTSVKVGEHENLETEGRRYKTELEEFERMVDAIFRSIVEEMDHYCEHTIQKEVQDALDLRREVVEEKIMATSRLNATELQYGYENLLLPEKLSALKESYQIDFNTYIQYWTKKVRDLEKKLDVLQRCVTKQLETRKLILSLEHLPLVKKRFQDKVEEVLRSVGEKIRKAMEPLKQKREMILSLRKENSKLLDSVHYYMRILPEFTCRLKEFVRITQDNSPQKAEFLNALDNIDEYKKDLLKQHNELKLILEMDDSSSESLIAPAIQIPKKEEEEMAFDLANRILSDGDLDETAKQLLTLKFIIVDLLKRVIPSPVHKYSEDYLIKGLEDISNIKIFRTKDELFITRSVSHFKSLLLLDKLSEVNKKLDLAFEVVGAKYSIPDLVTVGKFLNKRIASVGKILEKHQEMLKNEKLK